MWILSASGDLLEGKRIWLKPGKSYLFGRTKSADASDDNFRQIVNKSVSRKHLVISVASVKPNEALNVYSRSNITITDESKLGTTLDEQKFNNETRALTAHKHLIKLGNYEQILRIAWQPVVFCFSVTSKQQQRHDHALAPHINVLGEHDIKVQIPYIIDSTTHVVSSKRNVPKGLQALINGKSIVKDSFVDAVVAVVTPRDGHHSVGHGLTPLEEDFDGNWPNANRYLPEPGNEPIPRPAELFIPNAERIHIFNGYTFIFVDRSQYENLGDALTNGGAKTKLFELELGRTTVAEVAAFVKETAGEEGTGELETAGQGKGVVFVRFRGKGDTEQWALAFLHDIDAALGQRSVEQNEFLDAILYNDASTLRRPLLDAETEDVTAQPSNANHVVGSQVPQPSHHQSAKAGQGENGPVPDAQRLADAQESTTTQPVSRLRSRRTLAQSRFQGYDDFDMSQLTTRNLPDHPGQTSPHLAFPTTQQQQDEGPQQLREDIDIESQSLFVTDSQDPTAQSTAGRKRRLDEGEEYPTHDSVVDSLLPGVAKMKKRRLETHTSDADVPVGASASPGQLLNMTTQSEKPPTKKKPTLDVRSVAKQHAEALDARVDSTNTEGLEDDDVDIAGLRNLAIVEEMDVQPRSTNVRNGAGTDDQGRWDERWNGRKNFKRFRRQGGAGGVAVSNRAQRIVVRLEEAKRKDYGMSEPMFSRSEDAASLRRIGRGQSRAPSQSQCQTLRRDSTIVIEDIDGEPDRDLAEEVAGQPRDATLARAVAAQHERDATQNNGRNANNKRPASQAQPQTSSVKKRAVSGAGRRSATGGLREDSDEEDLAFVPSRLRGRAR